MTTTEPATDAAPADTAGFAGWVRPHLPAMSRLAARLPPHATLAWLRSFDGGTGIVSSYPLLRPPAEPVRRPRRPGPDPGGAVRTGTGIWHAASPVWRGSHRRGGGQ